MSSRFIMTQANIPDRTSQDTKRKIQAIPRCRDFGEAHGRFEFGKLWRIGVAECAFGLRGSSFLPDAALGPLH